MRDVFGETLVELIDQDSRVIVLDGDLANSTKADRVAAERPARFLQMGIAEQNMVGVAVGLASTGHVPWLSSFAVFFTHRALDPVRMLVAQTGANVKIGAAYAGLLTGLTGKTHQDVQDIAIMRAMPGMTVLAPADGTECAQIMRWATAYDGPVYLRLARDAGRDVVPSNYNFRPDSVNLLRPAGQAIIVSTGVQTGRCLDAAAILDHIGIHVGVLHVPVIKPFDVEGFLTATTKVPLVISVEEHTVLGGLGGLVAETLAEHAPARLLRIGMADEWGQSAPNDFLLERYGLSAERVATRIEAALRPASAPRSR